MPAFRDRTGEKHFNTQDCEFEIKCINERINNL